jgi:2-C-methyl-D-erythritol 4-phosphate cytidylyltransferase / 2-C-methyl-D-erythritol 2,4-cyclodiphosphate synthase
MPGARSRESRVNAIVVAAGSSTRFGANKLFVPLAGRPLLCTTLESICNAPVTRLVVVCRSQDQGRVEKCLNQSRLPRRVLVLTAPGGSTREESVSNGLDVLISHGVGDGELLLVHDGARPLVGTALLKRLLVAKDAGDVVVPVIPVADSLRRKADGGTEPLDRHGVVAVQTPQLLRVAALRAALARMPDVAQFGDEATLVGAAGGKVATVEGDVWNTKVTVPGDASVVEAALQARTRVVVGFGYDIHRFVAGRPLILGGTQIRSDVGLEGTSDADAVLHAIMDAILGCTGSGDIGGTFPSSDNQYVGIASTVLLERVMSLRKTRSLQLMSLDVTIVAERPRLQSYQEAMRRRLATLLGLRATNVDVKVTGNDAVGWIGRGEGIAALCVVTALRRT